MRKITQKPISGIYPQLAWTNGTPEDPEWECGTGAVVPWAGKLWFITYPAHKPFGSEDKLYSLDENMQLEEHPESVGGTHASRMIHKESEQLIIGPYFIDQSGNVRVVSPEQMPGRLTGVARHLTDPAYKVTFYTMESGIYDVDVHTLEVTTHYQDTNDKETNKRRPFLLQGVHGKGAYSGQGRFVISNNGLGGVLAEWNGEGNPGERSNWTIIDQNKYTEITGPGGLYGSPDDSAPLWALGWDEKSVLLNVCDAGVWTRFRLPMASYTHSADDGWFTEWPRIRDVGREHWLMDMFGMLYEFPPSFTVKQTAGIRPISVHHKMIVDFAEWNGHLVLGCNDASVQYNPLTGRCQSNLLFTDYEQLEKFGQPHGWGSVWSEEDVEANQPSEAFHFAGYADRTLHVKHETPQPVTFAIELDVRGDGVWSSYKTIEVPASGYAYDTFPEDVHAEWIRLVPQQDAEKASGSFTYGPKEKNPTNHDLIRGLTNAGDAEPRSDAILFTSDDMRLPLHVASTVIDSEGELVETKLYEVMEDFSFKPLVDEPLREKLTVELSPVRQYEVDEASVIVTDSDGGRFRLPKGNAAFDKQSAMGCRRHIREVVTERSLMNMHGSFYELPDPRSGGMRKIQPICTHNKLIYDFCSWRGMLVLSGVAANSSNETQHIKMAEDSDLGLWFGNVDDLRSFGAPRGVGGPWLDSDIQADQPSDPYLMIGYLSKHVVLSHRSKTAISITIEVDVKGTNQWSVLETIAVPANEEVIYHFPDGYSAHWVRVSANQATKATAMFYYE